MPQETMTLARQLATSGRDDPRIRPIAVVLMGLVLAVAFLLRFDAAVARYGTVPGLPVGEGAQRALQRFAAGLRPAAVAWEPEEQPYRGGDPAAYLNKARAMERFYAADIREPLYVASVKAGLWAFDDRDVAITYVSMAYSMLLVWATYLLGAYAFSRRVGLGAALLLAAEFQVIDWSVQGWRDDAFAFFFVLSAYGFLRLATRPSGRTALAAGAATGLSTLTRITSLSFVLPGFAFALLPRVCGRFADAPGPAPTFRQLLRAVSLAALLMMLLLGPFLLNCWLEYGDPLYSINFATRFYRERAGQASEEAMDVGAYLLNQARTAPVAFTDLALNGFTVYPFGNKWRGFGPWSPSLPAVLSWLSLLGLGLFLWSPSGRYLLLIGLAAIAPYAFTWRIAGGAEWRFTMHVYPIYLLAAVWAVDSVAAFAARLSDERFRLGPLQQRSLLRRGAVTAILGVALAVALNELPHAKILEDLRAGRTANLRSGANDTRYFARGWYPPVSGPNVTARYDREDGALVRLPMIPGRAHRLTLRLQPYHQPGAAPQRLSVYLNGEPLTDLELQWEPSRVGSYVIEVPASRVREGLNDLEFRGARRYRAGSGSGNPFVVDGQRVGFFVWYVNVTALEGADGMTGAANGAGPAPNDLSSSLPATIAGSRAPADGG